ncbi:kinase-like domain-containing protein, partial [Pisolithus microcarpus]
GEVFCVCNVLTSQEFTVKLSPANDPASTLHHEYEIICKLQGILGIPQVISFGREPPYNVMILECLGPSLDKVFNSCCRSFSPHTIATIGQQLIHRLKSIHLCNFIHCDVKPSNILISTGQDASLLYLIDFSIVKQYRNPYTHLHNGFGNCGSFLGSHAFASISSQLGFERGR